MKIDFTKAVEILASKLNGTQAFMILWGGIGLVFVGLTHDKVKLEEPEKEIEAESEIVE